LPEAYQKSKWPTTGCSGTLLAACHVTFASFCGWRSQQSFKWLCRLWVVASRNFLNCINDDRNVCLLKGSIWRTTALDARNDYCSGTSEATI
jgi:hypothetical protein